jgi:hypothetical protein
MTMTRATMAAEAEAEAVVEAAVVYHPLRT